MGIEFSHCDACWSYGGFHSFRKRLAAEVGVDLEAMRGFAPEGDPGVSWESHPIAKNPIALLLNHSDCDGSLAPNACAVIAPRLRALVSRWPRDDWDRQQAEELARGMEAAAAARQKLRFR